MLWCSTLVCRCVFETGGSVLDVSFVPRDGSTMIGVVLASALRRRDDDLQLPVVSSAR